MDNFITRPEHEEFCRRVDAEEKRQNRRLELLEDNVQKIAALTVSIEKMACSLEAMAKELAPSGVAVNAVACGAIDTEMNACFTTEEREAIAEEIPAGRFGLPAEAAELVWALAAQSPYLTGQIIRLDGGWI